MKRGGRGTARLGLHIHEHEVGGDAGSRIFTTLPVVPVQR